MATVHATPQLRAAWYLHKARQFRHHRDCHCGTYAGYCTPDDKAWCEQMDAELDALR